MIVIVGFLPEDRLNGFYPAPKDLAQAVMNAFQGTAPGTWGLVYAPPVAPPIPTLKRWRVTAFAANVRSSPGVVAAPSNIVGSLKQGDIITQLDTSGAWIRFDKGWVSSSIMEAI